MSKKILKSLESKCSELIGEKVDMLTGGKGKYRDAGTFLSAVDTMWRQHCQHIALIRSIYMYFDRSCMANNTASRLRSVTDVGLHYLRNHLDRNPSIGTRAISGVLELIRTERNGEIVDRSKVKSVLDMLWDVGMYRTHFETRMLEASSVFYDMEAERVLIEYDLPMLLKHIKRRIDEENDRVDHYLNACSRKRLISIVDLHFLGKRSKDMVRKGFDLLMDRNAYSDLQLMYELFKRIHALSQLRSAFKAYVVRHGTKMILDKSQDTVASLLTLKDRVDDVVSKSFDRNQLFKIAREEAFVVVMNVRDKRPPELLAKFMDRQLQSRNKSSPAEIEAKLVKVLALFRFLNGKDTFGAFYKEDLARRLLGQKSSSKDLELFVIKKLKTECGGVYTNKMESMFRDMEISKDVSSLFREYQHRQRGPSTSTAMGHGSKSEANNFVHLLTTGSWPSYTPSEMSLPSPITHQIKQFSDFYHEKYTGRRLTWQHGLGQCVLRAYYPKGRKELHVSLAQACVLMLFNENDRLTLEKIQSLVGLKGEQLVRVLKSLCSSKIRLLRATKQPSSSDAETSTSVFVYNVAFSAKLSRIKINVAHTKETKERRSTTNERVARERQYQIDACIVRTMKARKTLHHNNLVAELGRQLKFPIVDQSLIKKRIESLLDREYIKRDNADSAKYHYVS